MAARTGWFFFVLVACFSCTAESRRSRVKVGVEDHIAEAATASDQEVNGNEPPPAGTARKGGRREERFWKAYYAAQGKEEQQPEAPVQEEYDAEPEGFDEEEFIAFVNAGNADTTYGDDRSTGYEAAYKAYKEYKERNKREPFDEEAIPWSKGDAVEEEAIPWTKGDPMDKEEELEAHPYPGEWSGADEESEEEEEEEDESNPDSCEDFASSMVEFFGTEHPGEEPQLVDATKYLVNILEKWAAVKSGGSTVSRALVLTRKLLKFWKLIDGMYTTEALTLIQENGGKLNEDALAKWDRIATMFDTNTPNELGTLMTEFTTMKKGILDKLNKGKYTKDILTVEEKNFTFEKMLTIVLQSGATLSLFISDMDNQCPFDHDQNQPMLATQIALQAKIDAAASIISGNAGGQY